MRIEMADSANAQCDHGALTRLNAEYLASDQTGDVRRYEQILSEDFNPVRRLQG
jgi:hypothetical protein